MTALVFGYGSLVPDLPGTPAVLHGWRRTWGVAMDNSVDIPGYKMYLDPDGSRPRVFVAFLDIEPAPGASLNGLVVHADLAALDRRERNYERVDVSAGLAVAGPVYAYRGRPEARDRLRRGRAEGRAVVRAGYLRAIEAAFRAQGARAWEAFLRSTDPPGLPVRELQRIDLA